MALTQSAWTEKTVNDLYVASCTVGVTTAENDSYTLRTPAGLDTRKPYTLSLTCSVAPDAGQTPNLFVWTGWSETFALSGDGAAVAPVVAGTGGKYKQILDDAVGAVTPVVYTFHINPNLPVADVVTAAAIATGFKANIPSAPCYVYHVDFDSTADAHTEYWTVTQNQK